ncbi:hypothetical protein CRG98_029800 [Punica granatum]|uniref:Uncharacterized protein n=1 Tax=Punica granatum TaxID=22663 RepID=A0A2I0J1D5_PUNGR|nr:hypothetical protein CRG98_029800 [Punica granatum]
MTRALPPPTPAGALPTHSGEIPPPVPTPEAQASSPTKVDLNPWVPSTHAPEGIEAPAMHEPTSQPANVLPPSMTLSAANPLPPSDPTTLVPPAPVYAAPPPMVFPDSLAGVALDWYMSLKAADIPTWADLSSKFIDQYRKKLDIGVKLGKIEGPAEKKEGESSKKAATGTPSAGNRRGRDAFVNAVKSGRQAPQQYSINYTPAPPATQAYAPPPMHYQQQLPAQQVYYFASPASFPSAVPQQYAHNYDPAPPPIQQSRPPASRTPQPKLRERIQQMTDDKQLTFNAVKPPNVQSNPLPDHGSSSGPSINMIGVCAIGEYETGQEALAPFVIEYVPAETDVGVMGVTRSGRVYENLEAANKGKAPAAVLEIALEATPIPQKKVTEEEAEAFMKIIKSNIMKRS